MRCLRKTLHAQRETSSLRNLPIIGVAGSGFWHSLLALGKTGEPITPWPEELRGEISGLTQTTRASDILRATTTSVFYRLAEILERIESVAEKTKCIIVSGGVLHSPDTPRLLADSLGRDLEVSIETEASLRGAAVHALTQLGFAIEPLPRRKIIRHDRSLAPKHRARRERQKALEEILATVSMREL